MFASLTPSPARRRLPPTQKQPPPRGSKLVTGAYAEGWTFSALAA